MRTSPHVPFAYLLFARAQRIESGLIVFWHILDVFLTFNLSCVFVQAVRFHEFRPLISLPKMIVCNPLRNSLLLVGAQRIESVLIIFWYPLDVFLTFNLSCVFVQVVRLHEFRPLISLP